MKPSKEAREIIVRLNTTPLSDDKFIEALEAAYAIDVAPLEAQLADCIKSHQKQNVKCEQLYEENERLKDQGCEDCDKRVGDVLSDGLNKGEFFHAWLCWECSSKRQKN